MKHYEDKSISLFPHDFYVQIVAEDIQVNVYTLRDYRVATNNSARKSSLAKKTSRFSFLREMKRFWALWWNLEWGNLVVFSFCDNTVLLLIDIKKTIPQKYCFSYIPLNVFR